jgi:CHAT domain
MKRILILASNPKNDLALDREIRDLEGVVKRSRNRDQFEVRVGSAVRPEDLQELLLDYEPQIVHFCGHGTGEQGIVLQNSAGREQLVTTNALSSLFKLFTGKVECVLLNACYSEVQADAISQHINYVIGMSQTILDDAAIAFATGFYRGLGYGRNTEEAYHFGCNAIELMPSTTVISRSPAAQQERKLTPEFTVIPGTPIAIPEHLKPVLKTRQTLAAQLNSVEIPAAPTSDRKRVEIAQDVSKALEQEAALKQYRNFVRDCLIDNVLTSEEKSQLGQLAQQLGLGAAEAIAIFQEEERLRFATAQPEQTGSPIQALLTSPSAQSPSQVQSPTRLSSFNLRSLLLGGGAVLLGLGIAVFSSHLFVKEALPPTSPVSPVGDSVSPPISPVSPLSNPGSSNAQILDAANQQAANGELVVAIATLAQITSEQPDYGKATALAQDWYGKLLNQLKDKYGECEANSAIQELQKIPRGSVVYNQADISQWRAYQDYFNQIGLYVKQNNFDAATTEVGKIIAPYCKDAARILIIKGFLAANDLDSANAIAAEIETPDPKLEAGKLIADYEPPSPLPTPTPTSDQALKPPCYRVISSGLHVRSDNNLKDTDIGEKIDNADLSPGDIVVSTEQRQKASNPEASQPETITWLKISKPVEGWVAERQLEHAECQP